MGDLLYKCKQVASLPRNKTNRNLYFVYVPVFAIRQLMACISNSNLIKSYILEI